MPPLSPAPRPFAPEGPAAPASRTVERAVAELRCGRPALILVESGEAALILSPETAAEEAYAKTARACADPPILVVTARRAESLGLTPFGAFARLALPRRPAPFLALALADPCAAAPSSAVVAGWAASGGIEDAAIELAKRARLLPAVVMARLSRPAAGGSDPGRVDRDLFVVSAGDIFALRDSAGSALVHAGSARVPLAGAPEAVVHAFRPRDGGQEQLAIVIGEPDSARPVLARLHSECFTGDLLASLRCDCGEQLRGAVRAIADQGSGVILYLAQEGRGIGLVNKLRGYRLQDQGLDTMAANERLGFAADERDFAPAAAMLRELGFLRVRLLTNNPAKVAALRARGIEVVERIPHAFPANGHNAAYLRTKAARGGHQL